MGFGSQEVLSGLDLEASAGDMVAVTGPSGTGKTTLLMILAGILQPEDGTVEITGAPPADAADLSPARPPETTRPRDAGALPDVAPRYRRGKEVAADISLDEGATQMEAAAGEFRDIAPTEAVGRRRRQRADIEARLVTVKQRISYVPQTLGLAPWLTAAENVSIALRSLRTPPEEVRWRTAAALSSVGLEAASDRIVTELSGGQRQRVAVARSLAAEPDVLLADEPTAELDADNRRSVLELLLAVADRGSLVVVATHDPDVADACGVAYKIKGGRLADV
ncbi:MAG TPA: ATP-binding cassette domain-containing protein, partial [Acidimicrobiales bacterium]|jgi:putative ABC transport system ATP-binding protein|nr:ATP-binding cassette domain-containing protein [Acidimicrobiales bacterium]